VGWSSSSGNPKEYRERTIQSHRIPSLSFPIRLRSRAFGAVVILSIMSREALFKPLRSVGSMSLRSSGASGGSVVNAHRVIVEIAPLLQTHTRLEKSSS
jgi:hypothetical protein